MSYFRIEHFSKSVERVAKISAGSIATKKFLKILFVFRNKFGARLNNDLLLRTAVGKTPCKQLVGSTKQKGNHANH